MREPFCSYLGDWRCATDFSLGNVEFEREQTEPKSPANSQLI